MIQQSASAEPSPPKCAMASSALRPDDDSPGKVLIVEDEIELAEVLLYNLRREGFETQVAYDGLSACRFLGKGDIDLVLLDIMLPDLDGWEICRMIRSHADPAIAGTPVIMMTALNTPDDRVRGATLGADAYLAKPYVVKEVLLKTGQLIEQRRAVQKTERQLATVRVDSQRQKEYQQMLVHELKNQLAVISGYSQRLEDKSPGVDSSTSSQYLQAINRSSRYMNNLTEEFLLISQIEAGGPKLPMTRIAADKIVAEVIELYRPCAMDRGLELKLIGQPLAALRLNGVALKLILSSLVENAIKYNRSRGKVTVHLNPREKGLDILVLDDGPGIVPEDAEAIFGKYYRTSQERKSQAGSGLGLYTARTLTHAMGGAINVRNRTGGGACFRVRL